MQSTPSETPAPDRASGSRSPPDESPPKDSLRADLDRAMDEEAPGVVREFLEFLRDNKKWWLLPVLIVLALLGLLVIIGGSAGAPFIYTLF